MPSDDKALQRIAQLETVLQDLLRVICIEPEDMGSLLDQKVEAATAVLEGTQHGDGNAQ